MDNEEVTLNLKVPRELRTKINIIAKTEETTVKNIVTELIEDYIKEYEKKHNL